MKLANNLRLMMYDFANSAFTTIIVTVVYSVYFINSVVGGEAGYGEMLWGRAIGISMTMVALTAPIMGAIADYSRSKKKFLFINCYLTVIFTGLLYFVGPGQIWQGDGLFYYRGTSASTLPMCSNDAFLPELTTPENIGKSIRIRLGFGLCGRLAGTSAVAVFDQL
jgi:UMF1 family MFS transporter